MSAINIPTDGHCSVKEYEVKDASRCTLRYECRGMFVLEDDGQYSAYCLNLPGVQSCGDTLEDAMRNLDEAFAVTIETYMDMGVEIPWEDISGQYRAESGELRRTVVHV